ncbi:hypothetical protein CBM2589_A70494 [Cupriavidus taiwanensis]|uniref:Uncharacterized protein n=1 Tax=Cupriavidus taiwanensis TaxID=164546 RepID=A0A375C870_9BURK|nr:hypothetical protein CBM2589_A70494 [Cupriavidus taiwanensis]
MPLPKARSGRARTAWPTDFRRRVANPGALARRMLMPSRIRARGRRRGIGENPRGVAVAPRRGTAPAAHLRAFSTGINFSYRPPPEKLVGRGRPCFSRMQSAGAPQEALQPRTAAPSIDAPSIRAIDMRQR